MTTGHTGFVFRSISINVNITFQIYYSNIDLNVKNMHETDQVDMGVNQVGLYVKARIFIMPLNLLHNFQI